MGNVIGLSQYHEDNLRKLAAYLLSGNLSAKFNMAVLSDDFRPFYERSDCGTIGCAAGHGPYAGIPKRRHESWETYIERQFGISTTTGYYYSWLFQGEWAHLDNTAEGAAKRMLWLLEKGLPENAGDQCNKRAPLCYL